MSRIYDALQKSQGENPSTPPLVSPQPEVAAAPVPPAVEMPPMMAEDSAAATLSGVPADVAAVLPRSVISSSPTDASWLHVPAERVLRPLPQPEQRLVSIAEPDGVGAEMFRVLATRLAHMQRKRRLQRLLITSSESSEGKSVVATNLALALCRRPNERVLLVEADLRCPTARTLLTSSFLPGIAEWSAGKLPVNDLLYRVNDLPLWFLSAGKAVEEPMPLLESESFAKLLEAIASSFDWVLLDGTPMLPMADAASLSRLSDGVLVVVREGRTRRRVLSKALRSIDESKLVGMVFNGASMLNIRYSSYYGKYGKSKKALSSESEKVHAATA